MQIKVTKDLSRIPRRVNTMTKLGQYALINQVHSDMNNYVPFLRGDLRNQSTQSLDSKSVIYNVPYARVQFFAQFKNYTTPGTGPRWDLKAKAIHGKSWERVTKRAMK